MSRFRSVLIVLACALPMGLPRAAETAQDVEPSVFPDSFESGDACNWSAVLSPDPADAQDNDCDELVDEDGSCLDGDGFCPGGGFVCNSTNDDDCEPICGNEVAEAGETCDPCTACPAESYSCFAPTGSAETCNLACHVAVTSCGIDGDGCCPYAGEDGCSATNDDECTGTEWKFLRWVIDANYGSGCHTLRVYGISASSHYLFTTCAPEGVSAGTGDPTITAVVDSNGQSYAVGNDDCVDPVALPQLAGWSCHNTLGQQRMACASPNPGGFAVIGSPTWIDVTVCRVNEAGSGVAPFHVWWNGSGTPNSG